MAFKGTLDFYVHRGQFCCRSWPRRPTMPRSPAVQAAGAAFADFTRRVVNTDPEIIRQAKEHTRGTSWTWRDLLTSAAYGRFVDW